MQRALLVLALAAAAQFCHAEIKLPALISDNMVLQQQRPVRIWGKSTPGEAVSVRFLGQSYETQTTAEGKWEVFLPPMKAGGPYDMTIEGANTIQLHDILIGEVWVASGQSNMAWTLRNSKNAEAEIAAANHPSIRFFQVKTTVADQPADDVTDASWKMCTPENAPVFSGVAYFFARDLLHMRGVPIGIIQSAVGGTPAQAWTSAGTLLDNPALQWYRDRWAGYEAAWPEAKVRFEQQQAAWKQTAAKARAEGKQPPPAPRAPLGSPGHTHTPTGLFNGMIAPLVPYAIRGAIWYQGESNASPTDNELYRVLFAEMIQDWRRHWAQGNFPFLWVQLASFGTPAPGTWPVLRDSQTATLSLANTGQALAIDIGEPTDIHPKDKLTVGQRLALAARHVAYGEKIVHSGPVFRQMTKEKGKLRLWFDHTGSGLMTLANAPLTGFRIANADGQFFKAEAEIVGDTVVVSSPMIGEPEHVRYAWENDPQANLYNREGLPATPFRTDQWK